MNIPLVEPLGPDRRHHRSSRLGSRSDQEAGTTPTFTRRTFVVGSTLAVAGGAAATLASSAYPAALLPDAEADTTKTRLNTRCTSSITQSTGNVYWSENLDIEQPSHPSQNHRSILWRASKHKADDAHMLWSQYSASYLGFGRPTWAKVGATWWGFVAAEHGSSSEIWRFDLADPEARPAVVARSARRVQPRWVEADGSHVYWVDSTGIYRAPVGGGAAVHVVPGAGITDLQLDQGYLYYLVGGRSVARLPLAGGSTELVHRVSGAAGPDVSSVRVKSGWLVWSDAAGAVRKRLAGGGASQVLQTFSSGPVALDFDGTSAVYSFQYRHWNGEWKYQIVSNAPGRPAVSTRLFAAASAVLSDPTGFNWVESGALWRLSY